MIQPYTNEAQRRAYRRAILPTVAAAYGLTVSQLRGPRRDKERVQARRLAVILLVETGLSQARIARHLHRDRSTICHHLQGASLWLGEEEASTLADLRDALRAVLRANPGH